MALPMTDEEKFKFDLCGFLVRPAVLTASEVGAIREQVDRIKHDPESLPPAHRSVPGGASSVLLDHPAVLGVLHEVIGPDLRVESVGAVWREQGQRHAGVHGGHLNGGDTVGDTRGLNDATPIDPIFGYRVAHGRIHAGMVRVIFELQDVAVEDGATKFMSGSHKRNVIPSPSPR